MISKYSLVLGASVAVMACSRSGSETGREPGQPLAELSAAELGRFAQGHALFSKPFTPEEGLGPLFNQDRCSSCHDLPVVGGTGVETVRKATRFTPPDRCNLLESEGGDNIQERATPALQALGIPREATPDSAARSTVSPPSLFGLGLIERIPEHDLIARADPDDADRDGISGRVSRLPDGRLGRFGRKADAATIEEFIDTALRFEMGLTTYLHPAEETVNGRPLPAGTDPAADPEIDREKLDLLADYVRFLAPPAQFGSAQARDTLRQGEALFEALGCGTCHTPSMRTARSDVAAFDRKRVYLYSDMLLHDMGPASSGVCSLTATPTEYRTARLMGLRFRVQYLHDGSGGSIDDAIRRHGGEAEGPARRFERLNAADKAFLIRFLGSL